MPFANAAAFAAWASDPKLLPNQVGTFKNQKGEIVATKHEIVIGDEKKPVSYVLKPNCMISWAEASEMNTLMKASVEDDERVWPSIDVEDTDGTKVCIPPRFFRAPRARLSASAGGGSLSVICLMGYWPDAFEVADEKCYTAPYTTESKTFRLSMCADLYRLATTMCDAGIVFTDLKTENLGGKVDAENNVDLRLLDIDTVRYVSLKWDPPRALVFTNPYRLRHWFVAADDGSGIIGAQIVQLQWFTVALIMVVALSIGTADAGYNNPMYGYLANLVRQKFEFEPSELFAALNSYISDRMSKAAARSEAGLKQPTQAAVDETDDSGGGRRKYQRLASNHDSDLMDAIDSYLKELHALLEERKKLMDVDFLEKNPFSLLGLGHTMDKARLVPGV
jgi:hypothetical protein